MAHFGRRLKAALAELERTEALTKEEATARLEWDAQRMSYIFDQESVQLKVLSQISGILNIPPGYFTEEKYSTVQNFRARQVFLEKHEEGEA